MVETYEQTLDRICVLYKQIKYNKRQSLPLGAHLTEKRQEKVFLTLTLRIIVKTSKGTTYYISYMSSLPTQKILRNLFSQILRVGVST